MTIPCRLGELLRGRGEWSIIPTAFSLPTFTIWQYWHAHFHHDPDHPLATRLDCGVDVGDGVGDSAGTTGMSGCREDKIEAGLVR